jgi:hypothetical protein
MKFLEFLNVLPINCKIRCISHDLPCNGMNTRDAIEWAETTPPWLLGDVVRIGFEYPHTFLVVLK